MYIYIHAAFCCCVNFHASVAHMRSEVYGSVSVRLCVCVCRLINEVQVRASIGY